MHEIHTLKMKMYNAFNLFFTQALSKVTRINLTASGNTLRRLGLNLTMSRHGIYII